VVLLGVVVGFLVERSGLAVDPGLFVVGSGFLDVGCSGFLEGLFSGAGVDPP
jgi:hypothetical protein